MVIMFHFERYVTIFVYMGLIARSVSSLSVSTFILPSIRTQTSLSRSPIVGNRDGIAVFRNDGYMSFAVCRHSNEQRHGRGSQLPHVLQLKSVTTKSVASVSAGADSNQDILATTSTYPINHITKHNGHATAPSSHMPVSVQVESVSSPEQKEMQSVETKGQHENANLDLSKTIYISSMKTPMDAYIAFAEKGKANAKMSKHKIFHQSLLGGCYIGFGSLLSLCVAGNMAGIGVMNPGLQKMMYAALFPVNLLLIVTTGGQIFTGNSATCAAARYEGWIDTRELVRNWVVSILGNVVGCLILALAASYVGLLTGGAAALCSETAIAKCSYSFSKTFLKAVLCNWMVTLAVFLSGASNDIVGKLVGIWLPISTFVAIGLEHSIANMFLLPAALLINTVPLTVGDIIVKNLLPVLLGNAVAGAFIVAASYSYQFGRLGQKRRSIFGTNLAKRELAKRYQHAKI